MWKTRTNRLLRSGPLWLLIAAAVTCQFAHCLPATAQSIQGFTEPFRSVEVATAEPGIIARISVREGDTVRQGQPLASLDVDVLEASLAIAQKRMNATGRVEAAEAELKMRRDRLEKLQQLRAAGHANQTELDRAEMDVTLAASSLKVAQEELAVAALECKRIEMQISRRRIHSPMQGVVVEVYKEEGEAILANDPRILRLVQLDQLRAVFSTSIDQSSSLQKNQKVSLFFPATNQRVQGCVEYVSEVTDAQSGTVRVNILIDNTHRKYRSGMKCVLVLGQTSLPTLSRFP